MAELDDKVIVTKDKITTIADTIREEGGTSDLMTLDEMPDNIRAIAGGGSADVKRLGITLANNTATFNLNGYEIWQLIGSNKTIVADITYTDGNNSTSYNKSCTASLKSEASDTQTRIEASVMIYKNYTFYTRYFNMVIGASSMEYTGTYAVTDIVIPEEQYVDPLFTLTYPSTITCNKTFAQISSYYGAGNTKPVAPQLIYKYSSGDDTAFRSVYGEVEQYDEDTYIFTFNMGYARGVGKTQWQEKIVEIQYERGDSLSKIADYTLEYQKPIVEGDGINITTQGTGINRKSKISVDSSMIMIGNASGSVASIVDGADDIPLKSCIVAIEPVQSGSGDPSPQNERPIAGWTACNIARDGKNLYNESANLDKWISQDGSIVDSTNSSVSQLLSAKEGQSFTLSSGINNAILCIAFYDKEMNLLSRNALQGIASITATAPANTVYMYGGSYSQRANLQLEIGSTATTYEEYKGNTYNIQFPSEAGTVYGGTLDVTNGVLTVDRVSVLGGDLTWQKSSSGNKYTARLQTNLYKWSSDTFIICDSYKNDGIGNSTRGYYGADGTLRYYYSQGATAISEFYITDDNQTSLSDFETAIENVKFVYELATPQTYNVTPTEIKTLLGINNIFADTGDIENVEYTRDATSIINWLISQINLGA